MLLLRKKDPDMSIQPINASTSPTAKPKVNYGKISGYTAAVLGVASGIAGTQKHIKAHKRLAYAAGICLALHIGIIEYFHHMRAKNTNT